jgi:hypothetical protein
LLIIDKREKGFVPPQITAFDSIARSQDRAAFYKLAKVAGANAGHNRIQFANGYLVTGLSPYVLLSEPKDEGRQSIRLGGSMAVIYRDRVSLVLPPLNETSDRVEVLTLKDKEVTLSEVERLAAPLEIRKAARRAWELKAAKVAKKS